MVRHAQPHVVAAGGGRPLRGPAGGAARLIADTESTDGSFAMLEVVIGPNQGPPRHFHQREDEMWYILEGEFRFFADDRMFNADPGGFVFVPRGTSHCFQNLRSTPSRLLVMFTPSGMERFFIEHAQLPEGPVDAGVYEAIANASWMSVTGPPLGVSHRA